MHPVSLGLEIEDDGTLRIGGGIKNTILVAENLFDLVKVERLSDPLRSDYHYGRTGYLCSTG